MIAVAKLPATIASRYLPVRQIGRGGMGIVYEVVHAHTGEHLALKVLLANAGAPVADLHRFKREARAPAKIKSENVVHVLDADTAPELDDAPFLVMELLEGQDLEQATTRSSPSPATVVGWLMQIAPALDKAHRIGIVHRDLKPENLFLANQDGRPPIVKILDFGIAKITEEGSTATASGQVLGTPRYMAPEQVTRDSKVTGATDLYALGLVAYRLLLGESYYQGPVMGVLAELLHGVPSAPSVRHPQLGAGFDAWFLQACHREPARRFISASQQMQALAAALGLPSSPAADIPVATDRSPSERRRSASKQRSVRVAAAALGVFAVALGSWLFFRRQSAPLGTQEGGQRASFEVQVRHEPSSAGLPAAVVPPTPPASAPPTSQTSSPALADVPATAPAAEDVARIAPARARRKPPRAREPVSPTRSEPAAVADPYQDQK